MHVIGDNSTLTCSVLNCPYWQTSDMGKVDRDAMREAPAFVCSKSGYRRMDGCNVETCMAWVGH